MKKIMLMVLIASVLSSFRDIPTAPENLKELSGYTLRNNAIVLNDFNLWVLTNGEAFDKTFVAETGTACPPNFEKELVLAAKAETLANSYKIRFRKMVVKGNSLDVYFTVQKEGPARDGAGPVSLIVFPKDQSVKKVNFYHDNVLVRTIPIVSVY